MTFGHNLYDLRSCIFLPGRATHKVHLRYTSMIEDPIGVRTQEDAQRVEIVASVMHKKISKNKALSGCVRAPSMKSMISYTF